MKILHEKSSSISLNHWILYSLHINAREAWSSQPLFI